jgi:shikimate kinase
MSRYKRIFITGHPGAGKGVLAKAVAEKLGWKFINADLGLEFHIGRSLDEILGKGEEAFHNCQHEILTALLRQENIVVTTDASIICAEKNRKLLSSEFTVFLDVSTPVQISRTSRNNTPLLPVPSLDMFFDKLHAERDTLFEQIAILTINSDDSLLEEHADRITQIILEDKEIKQIQDKIALEAKDFTLFHKEQHTPVHLTEQQALCLKLLAQGKTSKEIARDINLSYRTVEGNIAKLMEILGCTSSKELIALYHNQP